MILDRMNWLVHLLRKLLELCERSKMTNHKQSVTLKNNL